jgi:D-serine deaminase-like pyridoxal phosphate-dependent protein
VIDLDVGLHRTGVSSVEEGVALAERVEAERLELRGVMAYEGHLVEIADAEERARAVREALEPALELCGQLGVGLLTGGSTPTYDIFASLPVATEVQAGSYLPMDATYAALSLGFEPAVAAVATVLGARRGGDVVVDAGSKRLAADLGPPVIAGVEAVHTGTSEEHNQFRVLGGRIPRVGSRLALVPGHTCTTMSLYRSVFGCRDGRLERVIRIDARDRLA